MLHRDEIILVTGGAGFIGSHLVDCLLADTDARIVVLDNLSSGTRTNLIQHAAEPRLEFIEGDVRDPKIVKNAMGGASIVYHLAARSASCDRDADFDHMFTTNVVGTYNMLRAAAKHDVRRVVFTSSHVVYGQPIVLPVEEDHPLLAADCHGASKIAAEAYCRAFGRAQGLDTTILRLAEVFGPRDRSDGIGTWLEAAVAGEDLYLPGGERITDFLWIGQAVEALVRAAKIDSVLLPINVASGTGTCIRDVARLIRRLARTRAEIRLLPRGNGQIARFVANVERQRQILRIEPLLDPLADLPSLVEAAVARTAASGRAYGSSLRVKPAISTRVVSSA